MRQPHGYGRRSSRGVFVEHFGGLHPAWRFGREARYNIVPDEDPRSAWLPVFIGLFAVREYLHTKIYPVYSMADGIKALLSLSAPFLGHRK